MADTSLPPGVRLAFEYEEEFNRGMDVSDMEGGPGKQRPKFSRPLVTRKAKLVVLSLPAKRAFVQWWNNDLAGGCNWFNFVEPFENRIIEARFTMDKLTLRAQARDIWEATVTIQSVGL